MKLLIDGDILAYKAAAACEVPLNVYEDVYTYWANKDEAYAAVKDEIDSLATKLYTSEVMIAFSDRKNNFRKNINPEYKANRSGTRKPLIYYPLREMIEDHYDTVCWDNLEADDVMGILGSDPFNEYVLVSIDKDMRTIPCQLYVNDTLINIGLEEANRNFLIQTLTGDTTDNYKGCRGVGAVKAKALLAKVNMIKEFDAAWDAVVGAFVKAGQTEEDALLNARMARILRLGEYNNDTGAVALWKM